MQFSPLSYNSLSYVQTFFFSTSFYNTTIIHPSSGRDQVSHSFKTTGNMAILYILTVNILIADVMKYSELTLATIPEN
jgi:hypothetical protein